MRGKRQKLICDTSFVGHLIRQGRDPERYGHWDSVIDDVYAGEPAVSVVTVAETRFGYLNAGWGRLRVADLERRLSRFRWLPVRPSHVDEWARLRVAARKIGVALSDNDLWVAAAANVSGHALVTCDRDHTRIASQLDVAVLYLAPPV
jgi:predicted nucleic acid-binding protein